MKDKILIIGAGGHGRVVADIALQMNKWKKIAFLDDDKNIKSSMGIEVIGRSANALNYIRDYDILVGIGNNIIREKIQNKLECNGASIPVLIHPTAIIAERVKIERGTIVMAGVVINCFTRIGKGCIINTGSTVDHDNIIQDYVHISPGVHTSGAVEVGKRTWLGVGSIVNNNINITSDCKIGAGAVVIRNITRTGTYVGLPAREI